MHKTKRQKGVALVIVLWMLILLTILAVSFSVNTRVETKLTAHTVQSAKANALAEAGVWQAVAELLKPATEQVPATEETWKTDGTSYKLEFADGTIELRIQDETGKIDLNSARTELLHNLILSLDIELDQGERLQLLQAILDWRDRDNLSRQFGAEDDDYNAAGYNYGAKDGPFNSIDELQLVMGITPEIYQQMRPTLTIYSHKPGINPDVAPREVLLALPDQSPDIIDEYLSTRGSQTDIASPTPVLSGIDPRYLSRAKGRIFTITSEGRVADTVNRIDVVIVLKPNSNIPYTVLSWEENNTPVSRIKQSPDI